MTRPNRIVAALLCAFLTARVSAQGTVQIGLSGEIDKAGGAAAEIEVVFLDSAMARRSVLLDMHFAERTSASDVAALLARRLEPAGARLLKAGVEAQRTLASLFIDDAIAVRTRLGHGLTASVTLGEDAPASARLVPPTVRRGGALLVLGATTLHAHTGNRGRLDVELEIDERRTSAEVAEALISRSIAAGWPAERAGGDAWRPLATEGVRITGCSIALQTAADWRLEVDVPTRRKER